MVYAEFDKQLDGTSAHVVNKVTNLKVY